MMNTPAHDSIQSNIRNVTKSSVSFEYKTAMNLEVADRARTMSGIKSLLIDYRDRIQSIRL